jgi:hypothetical protein
VDSGAAPSSLSLERGLCFRFQLLFAEPQGFLRLSAFGIVSEDHDEACNVAETVANRGSTIGDRVFLPVSSDQLGVIRQPDNASFPKRLGDWILRWLTCLLVDGPKDLR